MTPVEWMQVIVSAVSVLAALGITAALVAVFWRGATFTETITRSVAESERRLRAENQEAHATLGRSIERLAAKVDGLAARLETLATDVAFLRGRQEERDRS